jgi:TatD DNase family protein
MFDSHCHLDDEGLAPDLPEVLRRAREAGLTGLVVAGVDPGGWRRQDRLARQIPGVYVAYGVHPQVAARCSDSELEAMLGDLEQALAGGLHPPVALGEVGLDRRLPSESLPRQKKALCAQLALARRYDLPVILHVVRAHQQVFDLLRAEGLPRAGGVLHAYSGSAQMVAGFVELGLFVSFAGPVTYASARRPLEAAAAVPPERLLAETDCPDLAPEPHRGQRNEPAYLKLVVEALGRARGEPADQVARLTEANARRLFRLPPAGELGAPA